MNVARRRLLRLTGAAITAPMLARVAKAQAYPAHAIRFIVPAAAGGATDIIARLIAQNLSEPLRAQVFVENIQTGAGNVATGIVAKAPGDGYTLIMVTTSFVINPSLYAKIPYDPIKDFAPVTLAATSPHALVVNTSLPARNVQELVALVRASPGKYSYASPGTGQSGQLSGERFKLSLGLDLVHVPFNGAAPAAASTIAGHTPMLFVSLPSVAAHIREGTLRALAVTSAKRAVAFPDIPTMAEAGIADQESAFLQALLAPVGTPPDIVDLWYREVVRIVALPAVKARLTTMSFEPVANTPAEFTAQVRADVASWGKLIQDAKIKIE
jgi:tripartite-type tricarboxylate transporter receptor subunit TctC